MLSDQTITALLDIRDNIMLAKAFTAGLTLDSFIASRLNFYATTRALEIVSEAARRLPAGFREAHPALPWKQIMGVGNVYRHSYESVEEGIIWKTVHEDVDPLLSVVSAAIDGEDA